MGGFADDIEVALLPDNRVRVADNGRGIPVEIHPKTKVSTLETVMTMLHAGGKIRRRRIQSFRRPARRRRVGGQRALVTCTRRGPSRRGRIRSGIRKGRQAARQRKVSSSKLHGTIITFESDRLIFPDRAFNWETIVAHMRQQAYLVKGLRISILDLRNGTATPLETLRALTGQACSTCVSWGSMRPRPRSISKVACVVSSHSRTATRSRYTRIFSTWRKNSPPGGGQGTVLRSKWRSSMSTTSLRASRLRQQHLQQRGRYAYYGLQDRAHPHAECSDKERGGNGKESDSFTGDDVLRA